jgi:hypothetical protein
MVDRAAGVGRGPHRRGGRAVDRAGSAPRAGLGGDAPGAGSRVPGGELPAPSALGTFVGRGPARLKRRARDPRGPGWPAPRPGGGTDGTGGFPLPPRRSGGGGLAIASNPELGGRPAGGEATGIAAVA